MKRLIFTFLLVVMFGSPARAQTLDILNTSWIEQATLKHGLLLSMEAFQTFSGMVESAKYNGHYVVSSDGDYYHAFVAGQQITGLLTGFMIYANLRDADLSKTGKVCRVLGAACYARNFREWSYKWNRYGNPFDYQADHNKKALVGFTITGGHITDVYFGTGPVSGPLVDLGFIVAGNWLLNRK